METTSIIADLCQKISEKGKENNEDPTTLQSKMNAKLSKQRFWHRYENGLIKTIQMIPHNLYVSVKFTFI